MTQGEITEKLWFVVEKGSVGLGARRFWFRLQGFERFPGFGFRGGGFQRPGGVLEYLV